MVTTCEEPTVLSNEKLNPFDADSVDIRLYGLTDTDDNETDEYLLYLVSEMQGLSKIKRRLFLKSIISNSLSFYYTVKGLPIDD